MADKTADWRPGPTVCRCCLSEGCYKDISTEYFWMGKREVYAEMLVDTLNVTISYAKTTGPNSNSRLICEPCISRLRDASNFKQQVLDCERTFTNLLEPNTSSNMQVEVESLDDVKMERVKVEKDDSDDDYAPPTIDFESDDMDDEPLTKLASKVPKKETVDVLDMIDTSQITVKRKSVGKSKEPPKKVKKKEITIKPTTSKAKPSPPAEKKKKEIDVRGMAMQNAKVLLQYTTLYPFRLRGRKFMCVFCYDAFEDPDELRKHRDENHNGYVNISSAFAHIKRRDYMKVDILDLKCRICLQPLASLEEAGRHIKEKHQNYDTNQLDLNYDIGMHPYKLELGILKCQLCDSKFPSITKLGRHMPSHYTACSCEICGKRYLNKDNLRYHIKFSHMDRPVCRKCKTVFDTVEERKRHYETSVRCRPVACIYCDQRFQSYEAKQRHLMEEHNVSKRIPKCLECGIICSTTKALYEHYNSMHTDAGHTCGFCQKVFGSKNSLRDHMLKHTGEKQHQCPICAKNFSRRWGLNQHMWIHSEEKRFRCFVCNKFFNQKVCLKIHLKAHHPDVEMLI